MNAGAYFIAAGTLVGIFFKTTTGQEVATALTQIGAALEAGVGSVGPLRVGNDGLTVSVAPWTS